MGTQTSEQAKQLAKSAPASSRRTWTLRAALYSSNRATLVVAGIGSTAAAASTITRDVPIAAAIAAVALIPAVLIDVIERRLPNRMVLHALVLTSAALAVTFMLGGQVRLGDALVGAGLMAAPLLVIHVISPRSMGMGDVKAAAVLGTGLGLIAPELALLALALGSAGAATIGLVRRQHNIAFGPGLVGGAISTLVLVALPINLVDNFESAASAQPSLTVIAEQDAPR